MTGMCGDDKYIMCSKCKCKYLNNDFHLLKEFGFDRLQRQYKTCKKCRRNKQVKPSRNLDNTLPSLDLQTLGLPDNIIDTIMNFHGELKGMIPNEVLNSHLLAFHKIEKYIRKDNWTLTCETNSGRGGSWGSFYINIKVDCNIITYVIKDEIRVEFSYPTKHGMMKSHGVITEWAKDCVQIGKYYFKLNKFEYLEIRRMYKHETYSEIDD